MKIYKYKGYEFYATNVICANNMRPLYEIVCLKEYGKRPFLTSVRQCKDYISKRLELDPFIKDWN